jgi:hypothetical protein
LSNWRRLLEQMIAASVESFTDRDSSGLAAVIQQCMK